jgi:hypothetical protein
MKTASMSGMTGGFTDLFNFQQDRIIITIDSDFFHPLPAA